MAVDLATLRREHPEWNIVRAVEPDGGGVLAVGADGGVFALPDAQGRTPQYHGSYPGLAPEQRQGTRSFIDITTNQAGGYTLFSDQPGQNYSLGPQAPTVPQAPVIPAGEAANTQAASALIRDFLDSVGLPGLFNTVWQDWHINQGKPMEQIYLDIRQTPEFKTRFPAIAELEARAARGEPVRVPSPAEYLRTEEGYRQVFQAAGLPPSFYDEPSDFAKFIGGQVSPLEVKDRVEMASVAAQSAPQEVRDELTRLYGVTTGDLTAYFLDPTRSGTLLQTKATLAAAGISGAGVRTGFGGLSQMEAERLAALGMSPEQAQGAFGQAAAQTGLTQELIGETEDLTRGTQLSAIEGQAGATQALERRRAQRTARFEGGGGSSGFGGQRSGLGSAGQ